MMCIGSDTTIAFHCAIENLAAVKKKIADIFKVHQVRVVRKHVFYYDQNIKWLFG